MNGLYYFNHDDNAHNDMKIQRLLQKNGLEALGLYWWILEVMHREDGYFNLDDIDILAWNSHVEETKIAKIIDSMISLGLFKKDNNRIYSERMLRDMQEYLQQSDKGKKMVNARWNKSSNTEKEKQVILGSNTSSNTSDNNQVILGSNTENENLVLQKEKKKEEKKRKEKTTTEKNTEKNVVDVVVEDKKNFEQPIAEQSSELLTSLMDDEGKIRFTLVNEFHISQQTVNNWLAVHDVDYLQSKIDILKQNQDKIKNAAAWLVKAVEEDYTFEPQKQQPTNTVSHIQDYFEQFKEHYFKVFHEEFKDSDKGNYDKALNYLHNLPSKVDCLLEVIESNQENMKEFCHKHNVKSFNQILCSPELIDALYELNRYGVV